MPSAAPSSSLLGRWYGAVLWGAVLLLALLLAWQVLFGVRDKLAWSWPALKPSLVAWCKLGACALDDRKQPDALVIESSSFELLEDDTYLLQISLRSSAKNTLNLPALELTLTDSQDKPLLRRVIAAHEMFPKDDMLKPEQLLRSRLGLQVSPAQPIAGYRLLAFYP